MNSFSNNFRLIVLIYLLIVFETPKFVKTAQEGPTNSNGFDLEKISKRLRSLKEVTSPDCGNAGINNYIVNGLTANEHEFPFIVLILFNGKTSCGGAILNEEWVITAAHCFKNREKLLSQFTISAGSNNIYAGEKYGLSKIRIHNKFSFDTMNSDICLIKVDRKFKISSNVNGICLPTVRQEEPTGMLTVAGWGRLKWEHNASQTLQKVYLQIITDQQCSNIYSEKHVSIFRSNLCTYSKGRDSCEGDSGGPAFQYINGRATLMGIVSFGWECADEYPGVQTQISYFLDWINENAR